MRKADDDNFAERPLYFFQGKQASGNIFGNFDFPYFALIARVLKMHISYL